MAPSDNVFDILELTQLIANDLSQHDLFFCCLVNKHFFKVFTPLLWHSITIHPNDAILKFQSPEGRNGLLRNGHLIRVLRAYDPIALEPFVEFGTTCTNLVSLDVNHSTHHYTGNVTVTRTSEMLLKGRRRGSIGAGQKQISLPSMFSVNTSSIGSGLFGASIPTSSGLFGASTPTSSGLFDAPAPRPFGSSSAPISTGSGSSSAFASVTAGFAPSARARSNAERLRDGETYLVSVLERNPQLEFLVVPSYCLDCDTIVKLAGETMLSLKEFYSDADLWQQGPAINFGLGKHSITTDTSRIVAAPEAVVMVQGCLQFPGSELSHPLLNRYPRLRELQVKVSARVNHDALERIRLADRNLTYLEMGQGSPSQVAQILTLAPPLKHLMMTGYGGLHRVYANNDSTVMEAFLRHAPTLEHLETGTCDFSPDILQALLCSTPSLLILTTMEEDLGYRPYSEVELDALQIIDVPWTCTQLEVFECKILNVPRPDIVNTPLGHNLHFVLPPGPPFGPVAAEDQTPLTGTVLVAQQESHAVQRGVLRQLGRLTHLRVLCLGKYGRDYDNIEYSRLEIRGIRILAVDAYVDRNCLELSLESGLDELRGLQELEKLDVYQMAHRIGLAEVQWMVEHWPSLKSIVGLWYSEFDVEEGHNGEVEVGGSMEDSELEHVRWMRENRPDIELL
ncbi:hypothetical protein BGZ96_001948 [Linnemannia gamsii]|uniref:F-box domain-containing protein n=1 Tax=Linnemannia gamsii TaxID=64522 RepID=A0ABQ7JLS3_9FUNG|nr:hypothetical protein BGZ96_001948 [Linnemannia gamsii]